LRGVLAGIYAQQEAVKAYKLLQLWADLDILPEDDFLEVYNNRYEYNWCTAIYLAYRSAKEGKAESVLSVVREAYYSCSPYGSLPPVNLPQSIVEKWEESLRLIGKR
jgi:hypothetical protein